MQPNGVRLLSAIDHPLGIETFEETYQQGVLDGVEKAMGVFCKMIETNTNLTAIENARSKLADDEENVLENIVEDVVISLRMAPKREVA